MRDARLAGRFTAFAMGTGDAWFASLVLAGLATLLREIPAIYLALRVAGGVSLTYLACRIFTGAKKTRSIKAQATSARPVLLSRRVFQARLTQLGNPKTAVVYASIFTTLLPPLHPRQPDIPPRRVARAPFMSAVT